MDGQNPYLRMIDLVDEAIKVGYPDTAEGQALVAEAETLETPMVYDVRLLADTVAKRRKGR